jgi:mannose-6-phosphate isomerase-like protein (cupin superfamily)
VDTLHQLFDFSPYLDQRDEMLELIRRFAAHDAFRSAVVEELELDEDFHRRPLRPEDLEFLQFKKPVRAETVSRLPSLASQRLLMSLNEVGIARLPGTDRANDFERFEAFYGERNQVLGARIRPFLENYAFTFTALATPPQADIAGCVTDLKELIDREKAFWAEMFDVLMRNDYLVDGLKFVMVQRWSLAPSRHVAVSRAAVSGYFDDLALADRPRVLGHDDALLSRVAAAMGVTRREHSYWQFYLPTSLAKCNLLYALGSRPDRAFALLGAAYAAEAEAIAFHVALAKACPHLLAGLAHGEADDGAEGAQEAAARMERAFIARAERGFAATLARHGAPGMQRTAQGVGAATTLAARARWDLGEQLRWLSAIEQYCRFARQVDKRIAVECPDIDRETFVEPREMCSTTHVHNDHRLVVIESGDMIFWGNIGMQLNMTVGDMVLIPDGRLHGSTVVSEECTYHQPIIPDEWIAALLKGDGGSEQIGADAPSVVNA